jgi:hypothetical protein
MGREEPGQLLRRRRSVCSYVATGSNGPVGRTCHWYCRQSCVRLVQILGLKWVTKALSDGTSWAGSSPRIRFKLDDTAPLPQKTARRYQLRQQNVLRDSMRPHIRKRRTFPTKHGSLVLSMSSRTLLAVRSRSAVSNINELCHAALSRLFSTRNSLHEHSFFFS